MTEITGPGGRDATVVVEEHVKKLGKRVTREGITIWNTASQERLAEAEANRRTIDAEGRAGRQSGDLGAIRKSFTAPMWDEAEEEWTFAVTHEAAWFHERGAQPHEIRARLADALAFPWPDAPEEIQEKFEETFPMVFFDSVEHPGVPAIGFMQFGRTEAKQRLSDAGFTMEEFGVRDRDES